MRLLQWGRIAAAFLSLTTLVFLFVHDSWRPDNLFLVPDLILIVALAVAAVLPDRLARVALPAAFAYSGGVLATSAASYAVEGELGLPSVLGAVLAVALAVLVPARPAGQRS
ncbi:hypothetical protein OWR29_05575 [Actinoplanes sp. Pm04-4]|uniref:Uncharacterized protein n=1 Tax=Paractinoplanes pyxinae TaxID=2997416 RepID=A0ABT4AT97_9ACTN|nr:hypothetical protein [Actinoplanes pyxinae]MCY1137461.1 hypothetical protein [Actinoplanes pyxinae]